MILLFLLLHSMNATSKNAIAIFSYSKRRSKEFEMQQRQRPSVVMLPQPLTHSTTTVSRATRCSTAVRGSSGTLIVVLSIGSRTLWRRAMRCGAMRCNSMRPRWIRASDHRYQSINPFPAFRSLGSNLLILGIDSGMDRLQFQSLIRKRLLVDFFLFMDFRGFLLGGLPLPKKIHS